MKAMAMGLRLGLVLVGIPLGMALGCSDDAMEEPEDGHHHGEDAGEEEEGTPTGSACPSNNTLTYESFGKDFMKSYCTRCHSSEVKGDARNGAPDDHDFDSLIGILSASEHIDENAAAGPDSVNTAMPPEGDTPSEAERRKLGQWLACELAAYGDDAGAQH